MCPDSSVGRARDLYARDSYARNLKSFPRYHAVKGSNPFSGFKPNPRKNSSGFGFMIAAPRCGCNNVR